MSHYMPHVHIQSPVDLTAKGLAILGTLDIVRALRKNPGADSEELAEGTEYTVLSRDYRRYCTTKRTVYATVLQYAQK
jgi:hypothetical protein